MNAHIKTIITISIVVGLGILLSNHILWIVWAIVGLFSLIIAALVYWLIYSMFTDDTFISPF